jgi:ectoine hydroxylase-related dioxygenase (phytanoyl-CoA dioxygenase family)
VHVVLPPSSRSLAAAVKDTLARDGFVVLADVVDARGCAAMAALVDDHANDPDALPSGGNMQIARLTPRHAPVSALLDDEMMRATVETLLSSAPVAVASVAWRAPRKGFGQQALHADWHSPPVGEHAASATAIAMIDAFTVENGATRVVPGSHRQRRSIPAFYADPERRHDDERVITGPAGSVLVFSAHLWHAGRRNVSGAPRRALQLTFVPA